jgi:hypothetical protein
MLREPVAEPAVPTRLAVALDPCWEKVLPNTYPESVIVVDRPNFTFLE